MVDFKLNTIETNYIQHIVVEFTYRLRERYRDMLIDTNKDNVEGEMPTYDKAKFKEFENRLEDFREFLMDTFAYEILTKDYLYYNSDCQYEDDEKDFGMQIEMGAMDTFGKDIKQILGPNLSITISADKKSAVFNIKQLKDGIIKTNKLKIINEYRVKKDDEMVK